MARTLDEMHGCTPRECEILDRVEAGISHRQVARELGISTGTVRHVAYRYSGGWTMNDKFDRMVRRGTEQLLAAIERSGGRFA